jgi:MFS family permease
VTTAQERVRYRTVLKNREFAALFASFSLSQMGDQFARIALALLVYRRTGSSFDASATFGLSYLAYLVDGPVMSGLADRLPRLSVLVACDLVRVPLVLLLCVDSMPVWALLLVITLLGGLSPAFDSARSALQADVTTGEEYVVGNTLMGVTGQLSQTLGFVLGGALVAATSSRAALALDAATFLGSAAVLLTYVRNRPRPTLAGQGGGAWEGLRLVAGRSDLRMLIAFAVLGSVAVTSTEGLAVPVAHEFYGGPMEAGLLTAATPIGYLAASTWVLRARPGRRTGLLPRLVLISCLPLVLSPFAPEPGSTWLLWAVAGIGGAVNLVAGPEYVQRVPPELRGRAYGVAATSLQVGQGVGLVLAGWLGDLTSPRWAVGETGLLTLVLAIPALTAQATRDLVRKAR